MRIETKRLPNVKTVGELKKELAKLPDSLDLRYTYSLVEYMYPDKNYQPNLEIGFSDLCIW